MNLAYSAVEQNPTVIACLEQLAINPAALNPTIYIEDEIFDHTLGHLLNRDFALMTYFKHGADIAESIERIITWKFGTSGKVSHFLDFACGYGRSTRFLVQLLAPSNIWVSDIYQNAVEFQKQQFGVNGIVSTTNPEQFICEQSFDVIFVGSLFSHLPEKTFERWLKKLLGLLSPNGILVFSVHDEHLLDAATQMPASGIHFRPFSESIYLDKQEYGSTFVTEAFVAQMIEEASGTHLQYRRIKHGFGDHQDLYIVASSPKASLPETELPRNPMGHMDECILVKPQIIFFRGWTGDLSPGAKIKQVDFRINGKTIASCTEFSERADVVHVLREPGLLNSGWQFNVQIKQPLDIKTNVLDVIAYSTSGRHKLLHVSTLAAAITSSSTVATSEKIPVAAVSERTWSERLSKGLRLLTSGSLGSLRREVKQYMTWKQEPASAPLHDMPAAQTAVDVSQAGETQLIRELTGKAKTGYFVEVGANDGLTLSNTYGLMLDGWSGVCVEPSQRVFNKLKQNIARFPDVQAIRCACSPTLGPVKLFYGKNDPLDHMATISTEDSPWFQANRGEDYEIVDGKPLTVLLDEIAAPPHFDLLMVDAEGMDYEILQTMNFDRYRPKIVITEDYEPKNDAKFAFLKSSGYRFHSRVGHNTFWLDNSSA